jgi:hypothetical protein
MNGQAAVLTGMKQLADQSGYNPLAAAGTGGLNETLRIINAAIAERQQPGINAFRTGERADPNLAEAAYNNYRQGERGTIASRSMSGQISTALKGAKLGPSAAEMGHSLRSAFSESAAPSFKSMTSAMGQLRMLQARYLAQGDTKLAASIKGEIAQLVAAIHGTTAAVMGIQMGGNIYNVTSGTGVTRTASTGTTPKKGALYEGGGTLHVNVQVSAQQNIHANTMQHRWGLTPTEAGAR